MSRCGYSDSGTEWEVICWRGAVKAALRGARGRAFLRELLEALDALPTKRLIAGALEYRGEYCALGAVGARRGLDMSRVDVEDSSAVAELFGIARAMAAEIEFINDDAYGMYTMLSAEQRFGCVRSWVVRQLEKPGSD